jgi:hypothetical protein
MLVYRTVTRTDQGSALLSELEQMVLSNSGECPGRDSLVKWLIDAGGLECLVLDGELPPLRRNAASFGELTLSIARTFVALELGDEAAAASSASSIPATATDALRLLAAPDTECADVHRRVPEGFAYYALDPGAYAEAARLFYDAAAPERATVIGIRTIGTTLSAVVAAALERFGVQVVRSTVRPVGHPFERRVAFTEEQLAEVRARRDGWFAVVDEGPGISGSSFAATASALGAAGAQDSRIVLMPSWNSDGKSLRNMEARSRWALHKRFVRDESENCARAAAVARRWKAEVIDDWSGGQWRQRFYSPVDAPAANPSHEQRKFVAELPDGSRLLLKFIGLGRYGEERLALAKRLESAGFGAEVVGLADGYLATRFVEGLPMDSQSRSADLSGYIDRAAKYLAFRRGLRPVASGVSTDELWKMIEVNVGATACARIATLRLGGDPGPACAIDGRMLPHEHIAGPDGIVKVDAIAHGDDHFFPGPQNIAWDLAGVAAEWDLTELEERQLLAAYIEASGDRGVNARYPFHRIAYLAFRIGYTNMSADAHGGADGLAFRALESRYRSRLDLVLGATAAA